MTGADWFNWDGDGMGSGAKRQVATAFSGTRTQYHMFKGSLSGKAMDDAHKPYMPQAGDKKAKRTYAQTLSDIGAAATNQTMYIGTTAVVINRGTAALTLAGITLTTPNIGAATLGGDLDLNGHDLSGNDKISQSTKATRTIYCNASTGDDSTGDGTSGTQIASTI